MAFMLLFVLCSLSATHVLSQPGISGVNSGGSINPNIPANPGNPGQPVISSNPNNPSGNAGNPNFPSGFPNGPGALPGNSVNGAFPGTVPGAFSGNSGNYPNIQPGYPSSYPSSYGPFGNIGGNNYPSNQINGYTGNYQPGIGGSSNLGNFQSGYPSRHSSRYGGGCPVCRYDESPTNGCPICEGNCTNPNPPCLMIACAPNNQQNYPNYNNPGQSNGFSGGYPGVGNSGNPYGSSGNPSGNPYGNPYGNSDYGSGNPYSSNQAYATPYNRPCQCLPGLVRYQGICIPQQWCNYFGFTSNNNANANGPVNGQAIPVPGK